MTTQHDSLWGRHTRLLVWAVPAALCSSAFGVLLGDVSAAAKAVALSVSLVLGICFLNRLSRRRLDAGQPPDHRHITIHVLLTGLIAGALTGLANAAALPFTANVGGELHLHTSTSPLTATVLGAWYGAVLSLAYAVRWGFKPRRLLFKAHLLIAAAGYVCGLARALTMDIDLGLVPFAALFTGLPFALLWATVAICCDPAATLERWLRRPEADGRVPDRGCVRSTNRSTAPSQTA